LSTGLRDLLYDALLDQIIYLEVSGIWKFPNLDSLVAIYTRDVTRATRKIYGLFRGDSPKGDCELVAIERFHPPICQFKGGE